MKFDLKKNNENVENGDLKSLYSYKFKNGKKFPDSYIKFVEEFGYGLSSNLFIIYIPMDDFGDSFFVRTEEIRETYQDVLDDEDELWFDLEPDISYNMLKNLVPFAMSENGHYLFWDIENGNLNEFDIYITDFRGLGFTKVANNLYEFFSKITSETNFKKILPFSINPYPQSFKPFKLE
ncbi:SMI1-KNR4 cell-wall [Aquimarina amphilecti]|uniref:SMI1-KNR4 cell-wall n=1 Tax=Aquimarina amphilecti TaxID=1038014 RepID=A0A1H7VP88_AQUAM|nr:SMI1/KNR4 family protein [Aquimarina amphilecti]SEM10990.1 SMI1-KNR4 cell-wall [Aquimarina amphilecti]